MAWFTRFTRFGDAHLVYGQERQISCGVACTVMAAFKVNKIRPGTTAIFSEDDILKKAIALFGPNPLGTAGLNNPQMVQLLNDPSLKMSGWKLSTLSQTQITNKIIKEVGVTGGFGPAAGLTPVIVGVDWKSGGGHWVVVDSIRSVLGSLYATVCDPWDASVHVVPVKRNDSFSYTGRKVIDFDFWGKRNEYETPSVGGTFLGDVIWRA